VGDIAALSSSLLIDFRLCYGAQLWRVLLCKDFMG